MKKFLTLLLLPLLAFASVKFTGETKSKGHGGGGGTPTPPGANCYLENSSTVCPSLGVLIVNQNFESGVLAPLTTATTACGFQAMTVSATSPLFGTKSALSTFLVNNTGTCSSNAHQDQNIVADYAYGTGATEFWMAGWYKFDTPLSTPFQGSNNLQEKLFYGNPGLVAGTPKPVVTRWGRGDGTYYGFASYENGVGTFSFSGLNAGSNEIVDNTRWSSFTSNDRKIWIEWHLKYKTGATANDSIWEVWTYDPTVDSVPVKVFKKTNTWSVENAICSRSRNGSTGVVTLTFCAPYTLVSGRFLQVWGAGTFNAAAKTWTAVDATHITYNQTGLDETAGAAGYAATACVAGGSFACPPFPDASKLSTKQTILRWGNQVDRVTLTQLINETRQLDCLAFSVTGYISPTQVQPC